MPQSPAGRVGPRCDHLRPRLRFPMSPIGVAEPGPASSWVKPSVPQAVDMWSRRLRHSSLQNPTSRCQWFPASGARPQSHLPPTQPQLPALNRDPGLFWGGAGWGLGLGPPGHLGYCVSVCAEEVPLLIGTTGLVSGALFPTLAFSGTPTGKERSLSNLMSVKLDLLL